MHHKVHQDEIDKYAFAADLAARVVTTYAGQALALWPPFALNEDARMKNNTTRRQSTNTNAAQHDWTRIQGQWRCPVLPPLRARRHFAPKNSHFVPWYGAKIARRHSFDKQHSLYAHSSTRASDEGAVISCNLCGKWATTDPRDLRYTCLRYKTPAAKWGASAIGKGRHPASNIASRSRDSHGLRLRKESRLTVIRQQTC